MLLEFTFQLPKKLIILNVNVGGDKHICEAAQTYLSFCCEHIVHAILSRVQYQDQMSSYKSNIVLLIYLNGLYICKKSRSSKQGFFDLIQVILIFHGRIKREAVLNRKHIQLTFCSFN